MDKRMAAIHQYRTFLVAISKALQWVFFVALLAYLIVIASIAAYTILPPNGFARIGLEQPIMLLPMVCNVVAGALSLFLLGFMFRKIAFGLSPFCPSVARILAALGVVLLVCVLSGAVITPGAQIGSSNGSSIMSFDFGGSDQSAFTLDAKSLLFSVFCFALSVIFRYGTVLQNEADDLM